MSGEAGVKAVVRQAEALIGAKAQAAFAAQEAGDDAGWSGYLGTIWETLGSLTDYLARIVGALPHDRHYVRGKTGEMTTLAIRLQTKMMVPEAVCRADIVTEAEDAEDGTVWTSIDSCGLQPGHGGDHELSRRRTTVIDDAEDVALNAAALARSVGWMLAGSQEESDVRERLDGLRQDLDRLERDLARVPAVCWPS